MARLNIEDSLWKDERFQDLMIRTGNRHTAKGMVLELWALAQEYWFPERRLIPEERIHRAGLSLMLEVGMATARDGGIFAVGSEKAFDWLFQKQEAGKKGGKRSGAKRALAGAKRTKADAKHSSSETNPLTLPLPLSSSSVSDSNSDSSNYTKAEKIEEAGEGGSPAIWQVWESYRDAYAKRHGESPAWNKKQAGMIKQFMARIPAIEAPEVAAFYVTHNAARYVQALHPVGLLLMDAEKLRTEWVTGRRMTTQQARSGEKMDGYQSQLDRIARGEL